VTTVLGFTVESWGSSLIGTYLIPGTSIKLTMRKEIAPLLVAVARDFDREVEPLKAGHCWGFNPKHIEGSSNWSNHAWGGAIDLNAPEHPMGVKGTFSAAKVAAVHKILARYTYQGKKLLRWGGDYITRVDAMHLEINVQRSVALAAVKALQTPTKPPSPPATDHQPGTRVIKQGMTGTDVGFAQRWVGADDDDTFGAATKAKVIRYQKLQGLIADGICGASTWSRILGRTVKF
jgi:hypothetical protein